MARLVADSLELQSTSAGYWFEIVSGGPDDTVTVRGVDVVVPGASGRVPQIRVKDTRQVVLSGIVMGQAAGSDTAVESFRTRMDALLAIFDPTDSPFPLTIHSPLHGIAGTATLNVRFLRFVVSQASEHFRVMDIECESIDSPPEWVIGS